MNSMVSQQIANSGTVEGVADYEIGNVPCTGSLAHVDDDDNDRIEPSPASCMHFRLSYFNPSCQRQRPSPPQALQFIARHVASADSRLPFTCSNLIFLHLPFHKHSVKPNTPYISASPPFVVPKDLLAGVFHF